MRSSEYVVLHAADGHSGLKLVKSHYLDCVVLDLNLPDMSDLTTLINLVGHIRHPQMAVVVLTDFTRANLFPLALQHGAQSCLLKHRISTDDLDLAIQKAIAAIGPMKNRQS